MASFSRKDFCFGKTLANIAVEFYFSKKTTKAGYKEFDMFSSELFRLIIEYYLRKWKENKAYLFLLEKSNKKELWTHRSDF